MNVVGRGWRAGAAALTVAATVVATAPAALAAPGDWTNLSGTTSASRYPEVGNIYEPTIAWFGPAQQVLWTQKQSSGSEAYFTSILDAQGRVSTPSREVFPAWQAVTKNPALISVGGQRFLSFSGLNPGRSGAQYFATSPDGLSWNVSNGSMSETQSAYAAYGSDAVDNAGTPIWVGNAGTTTGIRWHVGTSDANPAPAGTDQSYNLQGCCAYNAAAARDAATGAVYAAFYSNSNATSENGIQVGQILPASAGWRQAPQSTQVEDGRASSSDPGQKVAMVGRAGGGVFVAYAVGYPTPSLIRIYNVVSGATLDIPGSKDADAISMTAEPDGRLWVVWEQGNKIKAVHTNAAATRLGSIGSWSAPRGTEYVWHTAAAGTAGGAGVAVTATTQNAINVWHTNVTRTLTVKANAASARRGSAVTFTVTDAGDPVSGASVRFGSRSGTTNGAGRVTISAPGSSGRVKATARKGAYNPGVTSVRVR